VRPQALYERWQRLPQMASVREVCSAVQEASA
jgi:hypothetical protein